MEIRKIILFIILSELSDKVLIEVVTCICLSYKSI